MPGAVSVICPGAVPKLEKPLSAPPRVLEATLITRWQLPGQDRPALSLSLPAATTTVVPRARASSKTCCEITSQEPEPPRERLSTEAGVGFVPGSWPG